MTTPEEHKLNFEQFMEDIKEKIRANLLKERQKIVGFSASEAATNALEYLLHKKNLITSGFKVNHKYFASEKRAKRYIEFEFPKKDKLITLMVKQDEYRTLLCYGKEKDTKLVEEAITNLNKIKKLIEEETGEEL
jgi:hypothetical protein